MSTRNRRIENSVVNELSVNMSMPVSSGIVRLTDVYRNRVPDFDDRLMLNVAGLWSFYLDAA